MPGLYSRETHTPAAHRHGVLWQQGKVQLDAEFNELVRIVDRHRRLRTYDIVGPCGVPRVEPDGFRIDRTGGKLTIGRGRIYVDGILAENLGSGAPEVDRWGEIRGSDPTPIDKQPYARPPFLDLPPTDHATHLVYLDVWEREVTWVEDGTVVEKAVGIDTTTRLQTAWAVRCIPNIEDDDVRCPSDWSKVEQWVNTTAPSGARLSTEGLGATDPGDPCFLAPKTGYRGRENRLYRVEIHDDGSSGGPVTFKWSRDNAAVAARVSSIATPGGTRPRVTVDIVGRDAELRFNDLDWVELTDDNREFAGLPGVMAQVHHVEDATSTIELIGALSDPIDTGRNARIRRWDQRQNVNTHGVIEVKMPLPFKYELEEGVWVTFEVGAGPPHVGDFWTFAARTVDASVEELDNAPPRGIRHHYCRLAIIHRDDEIEDCRVLFPPEPVDEGCECTVCVTPEEHNDGSLTIQMAIDKVSERGGKVCLAPGLFLLRETLRIRRTRGVQLVGKGTSSVILYGGRGPAIDVNSCLDVSIERLALATASTGLTKLVGPDDSITSAARTRYAGSSPEVGILLRNTLSTTVERCFIAQASPLFALGASMAENKAAMKRRAGSTAIALAGLVADTRIRDNIILADVGVGLFAVGRTSTDTIHRKSYETVAASRSERFGAFATPTEDAADERRATANFEAAPEMLDENGVGTLPRYLVTFRLRVEDNLIGCSIAGVDLVRLGGGLRTTALVIHAGDTRVTGNSIYGASQVGVALAALVPGFLARSTRGPLEGAGTSSAGVAAVIGPIGGAVLGLLGSRVDVRGNLCVVLGHGVVMGCDGASVADNELTGLVAGANGIMLEPGGYDSSLRALQVRGNVIRRFRGCGIAIRAWLEGGAISDNTIEGTGEGGIVMQEDSSAHALSVEGNDLRQIAVGPSEGENVAGIRLFMASQATVAGNDIEGVGQVARLAERRAGIQLLVCDSVRVTGNGVRDIGPVEAFQGLGSGIEVIGPFDRVDVVDNDVRAPAPPNEIQMGWIALRVEGITKDLDEVRERIRGDEIMRHVQEALDRAREIITGGISIIGGGGSGGEVYVWGEREPDVVVPGKGLLAVHGNLFETAIGDCAVLALTEGNLSLNDNTCLQLTDSGVPAVIGLIAGSAIINANHVEALNDDGLSVYLITGGSSTVLGNVTVGGIDLNSQPLPFPWADLNAIG